MSMGRHGSVNGESPAQLASLAAFSSHSCATLLRLGQSHFLCLPREPGTLWNIKQQIQAWMLAQSSFCTIFPVQWFLPRCLMGEVMVAKILHLTRGISPLTACFCQAINKET